MAEALRAWRAADRWSSTNSDAAHALHHAEAHLRRLAPEAMALYDERRGAGEMPAIAMGAATFELQTQAVMALLDELEVEAGELGLSGRDRLNWIERQVEDLTDLDRELPSPGRAAVAIAGEYRSVAEPLPPPRGRSVSYPPVDGEGVEAPVEWPAPVMSPDEAAAFLAEHPRLAKRVEEHGRELLAEHGPRLADWSPALPVRPSAPPPGAVQESAPTSDDVAGARVGGLLGYILSNGTSDAFSPTAEGWPDGDATDVAPGEHVDLDGSSIAASAETDVRSEPEGPGGPSLDW